MGVHAPGQEEPARQVDDVAVRPRRLARGRRHGRARPRGGDAAAVKPDGPVLADGARGVAALGEEEHGSAVEDPVRPERASRSGVTRMDPDGHGGPTRARALRRR